MVAGATRGGWGHALTPDAGSRPEPSNAQRPPRRRRRRRRRAASPTETNTSCLIFHARGSHPFPPGSHLPIPIPSLHPPPETRRRPLPLQEPRDPGGESDHPPPPRTYRPGSRGGFGSPAVAGRVRLSWSRPRAGSPCRPNPQRLRSFPR